MIMAKKSPLYFDYAATTPIDKRVAAAMFPYIEGGSDSIYGNPNSLHVYGQRALAAVDVARVTIAKCIGANHREFIFTASATEANNVVIRGTLKKFFRNNKRCGVIPKIIVSTIEHPSIIETVADIEKDGSAQIVYLPVNSSGIVDIKALEKHLDDRTILVSVMWVNNETGAIQPIKEIISLVEQFRSGHGEKSMYPLVHTDAAQAYALHKVDVASYKVDYMTLSAHKIYGPKGIGALYVREPSGLAALITGGGQEYGIRSGTENVAGIVGFSRAAQIVCKNRIDEYQKISDLSEYFYKSFKKLYPKIERSVADATMCSPHIMNIFVPYKDNLHIALDLEGLAISSGSACAQRFSKPSHVLSAMGYDEHRNTHSVRFSFGRYTTKEECDQALSIISKVLNQ